MTSTNRQGLFEPRKNNTIDLTISSDEEDSRDKPTKITRRRPPIVNSDSDSDDSDVNIISSQRARLAVQESDSEGEEEEVRAIPKVNKPHLVARGNSEDSGEDIESSGSEEEEEEEDELEEDESSDDAFVVPDDKVEPHPNPRPASMADALAAMSFKKKPSPASVAQKEATELDSDQENALRGYGFLPTSKPKPTTTDPRSFRTSLTSKSNPTFLQPKLTAPLGIRTSNQLPASSSSSSSSAFSSNSTAFNLKAQPISVKSRLGAQIEQENARKGIPIDVPKNPPSTSFRREEKPKASKGELSLLYPDRDAF